MIIRNSLANLAGKLLYPVLAIVLVPFYIHFLGLEGYGLVGFFTMLEALLVAFTTGLGSAVQREIAQREGFAEDRRTLRILLRTFELVYWTIGVVLGLVLVTLSGVLSTRWIHSVTISQATVRACMVLISIRLAVSFPLSIYQAVLNALQRQVLANVLNAIYTLVNVATGVVVVLIWRSVFGFYVADVLNAVWNLYMLRYWAWKVFPPREVSLPGRFDWEELRKLWRISLGLMWTHGIGVIVTQMDRVVISKLLPVADLGVYNVASAGGRLVGMSYTPFLVAVYPQTCQIAKNNNHTEMSAHLVRNAKVIMVGCLAVSLLIAFFPSEILELWTRNATVASRGAATMTLYVFGSLFLAMSSVFYQEQVALGVTRFGIMYNTAALVWVPVMSWLLIRDMGLKGAAWVWFLYGAFGWLFNVVVTLMDLLKGKGLIGYLKMIALTTAPNLALGYITRRFATHLFPAWPLGRVLPAGAVGLIMTGCCYVICFGFRIPAEVIELLRKPGGSQSAVS